MKKETLTLIISLITNFCLSLFKVVVGFIGLSSALVADGIHSFSDLVTDVVGIIGSIFAKKPSDDKHPFGHGRIEYLISIFIGLIIFILGFVIIYNSINHNVVKPSILVVFVSMFTIIVKFILSQYLIKKGYELNSSILVSSGKESRSDVMSSVVVLVSSILMQFDHSILKYSDIIAGIIVGILIFKVGFDVLKENISTILGERETDSNYLDNVYSFILENNNVKKIEDLVILKYGPYYKLITKISVLSDVSVKDAYDFIKILEKNIKCNFDRIDYVDISIYPYIK